ncbi:Esterase, partial [Operophtera brumata]
SSKSVSVVTSKGSVVGQTSHGLTTFLGVPYAKVNEERPFEETSDFNFTTPFNASDPTVTCPQVVRTEGGILQCLRLNIYVPTSKPSRQRNSQGLPVFVWFHGGGFVMGSAGQYDPKHLTKHGVIVVTANYRLGPYGFLCVDGIRNQGMKDQKAALRWVKADIGAFGGDPNNVTIGGQSFGGGAVDFHLYSNEILFDKAIIQSGSKYIDDIESRKDEHAPISIAQHLGSNATRIEEAQLFLNKANPIEVMRATRDLNLHFRVCADRFPPDESNFSERIKNTPILIGYNSKEEFARFANQNETFYKNLSDIFNSISRDKKLGVLKQIIPINLTDIVRKFYLGGKSISKESMLELMDFSSDLKLNSAVERSVNKYLKFKASVYKYLFSYTGGSPYKNMSGVGAYHTEELQYLFDMGSENQSEEQLLMKDMMTTMWANFIKFGDPTPEQTKLLPVKWTRADLTTKAYLNINVKMEMLELVYHRRMAFWELIWTITDQLYGFLTVIVMFFILFLLGPVFSKSVSVVTSKGSVVGQRSHGLSTFLGVPYAKVNEDRPFEETSDFNFTTPFNASDPTVTCPQVVRTEGGILQCLRLNIYVPTSKPIRRRNSQGLPVFVWFHGGGFFMGSAGQYDPKHLTKHGVIVVTANYRLGPYGFLCVDGIRNQGMKDQKAALRWVKADIGAFGGDPNNVTIGGQSFGGGAVDFHLYSNEILFNKAIIQSGSKYIDDIESRKDEHAPISIAQHLGSNATSTEEAQRFLNKANPIEVMRSARDLNFHFRVCADKYEADKSNFAERIKNTPILIGYNSKEDFARFANQNETFYKNLGDIFHTTLNKTFGVLFDMTRVNLPGIVQKFYLGGKSISKESMLELVDFSSDFQINVAVERSVDNYLKFQASVFKYLFSYTGGSPYKKMSGVGAYHTEELQYLFDMGSGNLSEEQLLMKDMMTTMWTNFIKFGDPTPKQTKLLPVKWTQTDPTTKAYLNIDVKMELLEHVYRQRIAFWELFWTL